VGLSLILKESLAKNLRVDGIEEEYLIEHGDTSQAEDSQPYNRSVLSPQCNTILSKSITKDIEEKVIKK
jgi:hypothetical protein